MTCVLNEDRELIEKALEGSKVVASLPGKADLDSFNSESEFTEAPSKELERLLKYFQKVPGGCVCVCQAVTCSHLLTCSHSHMQSRINSTREDSPSQVNLQAGETLMKVGDEVER